MNTVFANNTDLEVWEGWVGDTHSVAATWHRKDNRAQCGFQLFSTWHGHFTLMLLYGDQWKTPLHKTVSADKVRKAIFLYMSSQIELINQKDLFSPKVEKSFHDAHLQINEWLNEQVKIIKWFDKQR